MSQTPPNHPAPDSDSTPNDDAKPTDPGEQADHGGAEPKARWEEPRPDGTDKPRPGAAEWQEPRPGGEGHGAEGRGSPYGAEGGGSPYGAEGGGRPYGAEGGGRPYGAEGGGRPYGAEGGGRPYGAEGGGRPHGAEGGGRPYGAEAGERGAGPGSERYGAGGADEPRPRHRIEENLKSKSTWVRLVFIVLFAVVWAIAELVLTAVVVIQFLWVLLDGAPNERLRAFGQSLARYAYQIFRYMTFNSDERPFPVDLDWPSGAPDATSG